MITKRDNGVNAIVGVIIMVAVVLAIAATVYVYVENQRKEIETGQQIKIYIMNYSVSQDGNIQVDLGFVNDNDPTSANITLEVERLTIKNRVEVDHIFVFTKIIKTTIGSGATKQIICEPTQLNNNGIYRIDISCKTEFKDYPRQSVYVFSK
jgi:flagellin-like protein